MSISAVLWALNPSKTGPLPAEARLVLAALGDKADAKGRGAYPSSATLAKSCDMSERAVRRHLATLRSKRLIIAGDQSRVEHIRADRRPVVYDLTMGRRPATNDTPQEAPDDLEEWAHEVTEAAGRGWFDGVSAMVATGCHLWSLRGDTCGHYGVTEVSPKPRTEPTTDPLWLSFKTKLSKWTPRFEALALGVTS